MAAVRARFQGNAGSIQRLFFDYPTGRKIGLMCKSLAAARKVYRCVEPPELEKIAGTVHHGGIVAVVTEGSPVPAAAADAALWASRRESLLVLDRIGNAHNLGAIARTAAFFGVPRIIIPDDPQAARPNEAAYRVAEGGLEKLEVRIAPRLPALLKALAAAGYDVVGAAVRGENGGKAPSLDPARKQPGSLTAIVLGNEEHGLSPEVSAACTRLVAIPGSGEVESLNVSTAAAILIWQLLTHAAPSKPSSR